MKYIFPKMMFDVCVLKKFAISSLLSTFCSIFPGSFQKHLYSIICVQLQIYIDGVT